MPVADVDAFSAEAATRAPARPKMFGTARSNAVKTVGGAGSKEGRTPIKLETFMAVRKRFITYLTNLRAKIERVLSQISGC